MLSDWSSTLSGTKVRTSVAPVFLSGLPCPANHWFVVPPAFVASRLPAFWACSASLFSESLLNMTVACLIRRNCSAAGDYARVVTLHILTHSSELSRSASGLHSVFKPRSQVHLQFASGASLAISVYVCKSCTLGQHLWTPRCYSHALHSAYAACVA